MNGFVDANLSLNQSIANDADLDSKMGLPFLEREDIVPTHSDSRTVICKTLNSTESQSISTLNTQFRTGCIQILGEILQLGSCEIDDS